MFSPREISLANSCGVTLDESDSSQVGDARRKVAYFIPLRVFSNNKYITYSFVNLSNAPATYI